jgi:ankyrin repeat protein
MWFAGEHNAQVVALLRQHGADDNARNAAGRTPADLAAEEAAND